jgi:flagellar biosynthesis/type III secretory pathway chaperone
VKHINKLKRIFDEEFPRIKAIQDKNRQQKEVDKLEESIIEQLQINKGYNKKSISQ